MVTALNGESFVSQKLNKDFDVQVFEQPDDKSVAFQTGKDMLFPVSVKLQKTITLENSESARVGCGATVYTDNVNVDAAYNAILLFVRTWLNYESTAIKRGADMVETPIFAINCASPVVIISLDYGITLSMGDWKFAKADVSRTMPTTINDVHSSVLEIQSCTTEKIQERIVAIREAYKVKR